MSAPSRRLQAIAQMADQEVIADIGCDHAYVCILAVQSGRVRKAYACDVAPGPLENAVSSIERAGLQDRIFPRLQDGIENLPEDTRQVIITGMGGRLMISILCAHPLPESVSSLILSPHKDAPVLREWLIQNGFEIVGERWIEDDGFYPLIQAIRHSEADPLTFTESLFGRNPQEDAVFYKMLAHQKAKWLRILEGVPEGKRGLLAQKIESASALLEKQNS